MSKIAHFSNSFCFLVELLLHWQVQLTESTVGNNYGVAKCLSDYVNFSGWIVSAFVLRHSSLAKFSCFFLLFLDHIYDFFLFYDINLMNISKKWRKLTENLKKNQQNIVSYSQNPKHDNSLLRLKISKNLFNFIFYARWAF